MMDIKTDGLWMMWGDCLERMKEIPTGSVDLIVTDPPYDLSKSKGGGMMGKDGRVFGQQLIDSNLINGIDTNHFLNSCLRLFENQNEFCGVFFCSNKQLVQYLQWAECKNLQYGVGVWNKTNPAPLCNGKYLNDVEYWVYIKGNRSKIKGTYHTKSMVFTSQVNKKDKDLYGHPTCKPVDLMSKFIINHSDECDTILDPFMGSGSTGVAACNLGRNFIGIELDPNYYGIALDRVLTTAP